MLLLHYTSGATRGDFASGRDAGAEDVDEELEAVRTDARAIASSSGDWYELYIRYEQESADQQAEKC